MDNNLFAQLQSDFKKDVTVSRISEDIRGKVITIYGGNNLGKTFQSARFPNPIFLPCEKGMNAINGAIVLKTTSYGDLKKNINKLTSKKYVKMLDSGLTATIIIDGLERVGTYIKNYLCSKYEIDDIQIAAKQGVNLWGLYDQLAWTLIDKLISVGYCVVFLGHEKYDQKKDKYIIEGDSRVVKPMRDNSDIVCYLQPNGLDNDGKEIHSSAYLAETQDFFARCRFDYVKPKIEDFTAENLINAIIEGIKEQNKAEGFDNVDFSEQQQIYSTEDTYESVMEEIKEQFQRMSDIDALEQYSEIVENNLGEGVAVSSATKKQLDSLIVIRDELEDYLNENEDL